MRGRESRQPGKAGLCSRRSFLATPAFGILAGVSSARSSANLDEFIQQKMQTDKIPGVVVGIIGNDRLEETKAYGWAEAMRGWRRTPWPGS